MEKVITELKVRIKAGFDLALGTEIVCVGGSFETDEERAERMLKQQEKDKGKKAGKRICIEKKRYYFGFKTVVSLESR